MDENSEHVNADDEVEFIDYDQFQRDSGLESDDELREMYAKMRRRGAWIIWIVVLVLISIVVVGWIVSGRA